MGLVQSESFEDLLADGLESLMRKGATSLDDYVAGLNELNIRAPDGQKWSAQLLSDVLARLGQ